MILAALLLIPLAAGPISFCLRKRAHMEAANLAAFGATFLLAIALALEVLRTGAVSLCDGFFRADHLSALVALLTASVALVCAAYAVGYLRQDERDGVFDGDDESAASPKIRNYYALTPLFVFSMLLMSLANNLGVMWAAIEATTLASVFLVTFYGKVTSLEAAWKYAIIGGVGLSMAMFGTILAYYSGHHLAGSDTLAGLNWSFLAERAGQLDKTTMRLAFILALLGYGTKAGLAPMHTWKPDAYSEAPVPAAAILSSAMLNCALYGLVRFYVLTSRSVGAEFPGGLLLLFGVLSMGISVPFVLVQKNFRRLLAYHTIDHAGIMVTALGIGGKVGALALMLHMTFHTVAKSLLFLCAGNVSQHFHTSLFDKVKCGVIRSMPVTGTVFLMAMMAIVGMPPFSLFQSEFLILQAAFDGGHYTAGALFILFGTGIFAGAVMHVGGMVLGPPGEHPVASWHPWRDGSVLALAAVLVVIGFWLPAPLLELIRGAARVVAGE
ncbi:MAG TPA: proton-conducting transporter membrane subunit [Bryobacteraceae bacterium]|nr:proton-conducting transporter membrane subunit [Bryobacteraceae bacterium]